MELGVFSIIFIMLIIWYFGSTINKVVAKIDHVIDNSADMAGDEFDILRAEQRLRISKGYDELGKKIVEADLTYGKQSVKDLLDTLEKTNAKNSK